MTYRVMQKLNYCYIGNDLGIALSFFKSAAGDDAVIEYDWTHAGDPFVMATEPKLGGELIVTLFGVDEETWKLHLTS